MNMKALIILAGVVGLTTQIAYQKFVSASFGDLFTTHAIVLLIFIVGSSIGSLLGGYSRVSRAYPWVEFTLGFIPLFFALIFPGMGVPILVIYGALAAAAVGMGVHIPLYAHYGRSIGFPLIYAFYYLGGFASMLLLEWHYLGAGSIRGSLVFLGGLQCCLGLLMLYRNRDLAAPAPINIRLQDWIPAHARSIAAVSTASFISFFQLFWAFKVQVTLNEPFRFESTVISAAILLWIAMGGAVERWLRDRGDRVNSLTLLLMMLGTVSAVAMSFDPMDALLRHVSTGSLISYFSYSLSLACFLTAPTFFAALIFNRELLQIKKQGAVPTSNSSLDVARLGFFSALGNLMGYGIAAIFSSLLFRGLYYAPLVLVAIFGLRAGGARMPSLLLALLLVAPLFTAQNWVSAINRKLGLAIPGSYTDQVSIFSGAFSVEMLAHMAWPDRAPGTPPSATDFLAGKKFHMLIVDGHISHLLELPQEGAVALTATLYFPHKIPSSVVVGVGSGQAAYANAAISEKTEMVEISPTVLENLENLREYNNDLLHRKDVKFVLSDGLSFLRGCVPGATSMIFNSSTPPWTFNASKLYSQEFVDAVHHCLSPEGVYQTYFNEILAEATLEPFLVLLKPIARRFQHIDIFLDPYVSMFAYDQTRDFNVDQSSVLMDAKDALYIKNKFHFFSNRSPCRTAIRIDAARAREFFEGVPTSTLDRAEAEASGIRTWLWSAYRDREDTWRFTARELAARIPGATTESVCLSLNHT